MSFGLDEDIAGHGESEASVQERLREMKSQAAKNKGVKKQMKKDEGKAQKSEQVIIQFLLAFIHSNNSDHRLVEVLNKALQDGHCAFVLAEGLSLIYDIDSKKHRGNPRAA